MCAANPRTVVVLANGAPVLMPWADRPVAIVEAYLGGQAGRSAITSVEVHETLRIEVTGETVSSPPTGARGPGRRRFVATASEFEQMLGRPIPEPVPILPFTTDTVIEDLAATRLGRLAQRAFLRIADRQASKMLGDDPDPVLVKLSERMIREAPLRFLVSMSGGAGSMKAFDGLTKLLSTLRIAGRRS